MIDKVYHGCDLLAGCMSIGSVLAWMPEIAAALSAAWFIYRFLREAYRKLKGRLCSSSTS